MKKQMRNGRAIKSDFYTMNVTIGLQLVKHLDKSSDIIINRKWNRESPCVILLFSIFITKKASLEKNEERIHNKILIKEIHKPSQKRKPK